VTYKGGHQWDYSIDVQLEDGRILPLYLNHNTNQYLAAREFITKHQLQVFYLETIAKFIERERKPYALQQRAAPRPTSEIFPLAEGNFVKGLNIQAASRV
jgi:hypothetical protein